MLKISKLILAIIIVITMFACSGPAKKKISTQYKEIENKESSKINLKIWLMPNNTNGDKEFMEVVTPFLKENPNITITPTIINWETAWDKISLAVTSGDAPDVSQIGSTWVAAIASTGGLLDITDKYNENDFIEPCLSSTVIADAENSKMSERRYAIPWFTETRLLYYWKNACEKAGVDPNKDFQTWDDFKNALTKLKGVVIDKKSMEPLGMSGKNDWNVVHNFSWWLWSYGGDFLSKDFKKCTTNSAESMKGISSYIEFLKEGLLSEKALQNNMSEINAMFLKGQFATTITIPQPDTIDKNIGVTFLPKGPNGRIAFLGGSNLAVYKSSKHQEEAIKLIKFLTTKEAQVEYSKKCYCFPVIKEAYNDEYFAQNPNKSVAKEQIENARAFPSISKWGPIENTLKDGYGNIWSLVLNKDNNFDQNKIQEELDKTAKKVDDLLK